MTLVRLYIWEPLFIPYPPRSFLPSPCPLVGYPRPASMRSIVCLLSFLLLAGQGQLLAPETGLMLIYPPALGLTIDVGGALGNVPASEFLNVTDIYLLTDVSAKPLIACRIIEPSTVPNPVQQCEFHDQREYLPLGPCGNVTHIRPFSELWNQRSVSVRYNHCHCNH